MLLPEKEARYRRLYRKCQPVAHSHNTNTRSSFLPPSEEAVASSQFACAGGESVAIEETLFRSVALRAHALLRLLLHLFIKLIIFIAVFMIFRLVFA